MATVFSHFLGKNEKLATLYCVTFIKSPKIIALPLNLKMKALPFAIFGKKLETLD